MVSVIKRSLQCKTARVLEKAGITPYKFSSVIEMLGQTLRRSDENMSQLMQEALNQASFYSGIETSVHRRQNQDFSHVSHDRVT